MKHKTNLFDFIFKRKPVPQPPKEDFSMEKTTLYGIIKMLMEAYVAAKMKIDSLEAANRLSLARIKELEDEKAAAFALDGEMGNAVKDLLTPVEGSMGGH